MTNHDDDAPTEINFKLLRTSSRRYQASGAGTPRPAELEHQLEQRHKEFEQAPQSIP